MLGGRGQFRVRASKGIHLVVPRNRINARAGLITRTEKSLLFIIPWHSHWLIGTTDTDWELDRAHPAASQADIDYLLGHANGLLADPLTRDDVVGVYAGLRPLLSGESDSTSKLSREHAVASPVRGLTVIAGGKYTTYRVMAKDAVDAVARELSLARGVTSSVPECCTEDIPLLGAEGFPALWNSREALSAAYRIERGQGGAPAAPVRLLDRRCAGRWSQTDHALLEPLASAPGYLKVEAVYAATAEGALHLDDILARRTRISIETWDRGLAAADEVAALVAPVLGWDAAAVEREVEHYRSRVHAERESQYQPDDLSADAARLGAPDVRMGGRQPTPEADAAEPSRTGCARLLVAASRRVRVGPDEFQLAGDAGLQLRHRVVRRAGRGGSRRPRAVVIDPDDETKLTFRELADSSVAAAHFLPTSGYAAATGSWSCWATAFSCGRSCWPPSGSAR